MMFTDSSELEAPGPTPQRVAPAPRRPRKRPIGTLCIMTSTEPPLPGGLRAAPADSSAALSGRLTSTCSIRLCGAGSITRRRVLDAGCGGGRNLVVVPPQRLTTSAIDGDPAGGRPSGGCRGGPCCCIRRGVSRRAARRAAVGGRQHGRGCRARCCTLRGDDRHFERMLEECGGCSRRVGCCSRVWRPASASRGCCHGRSGGCVCRTAAIATWCRSDAAPVDGGLGGAPRSDQDHQRPATAVHDDVVWGEAG